MDGELTDVNASVTYHYSRKAYGDRFGTTCIGAQPSLAGRECLLGSPGAHPSF